MLNVNLIFMTIFHPHQKSNAFEMGHFSSLTLINSFNALRIFRVLEPHVFIIQYTLLIQNVKENLMIHDTSS